MKEFEKAYIIRLTILTVFDFLLSLAMAVLSVLYLFAFNGGQAIVNLQIHGLLCVAVLLAIGGVRLKKSKLQKAQLQKMLLEKSDYEQGIEDAE